MLTKEVSEIRKRGFDAYASNLETVIRDSVGGGGTETDTMSVFLSRLRSIEYALGGVGDYLAVAVLRESRRELSHELDRLNGRGYSRRLCSVDMPSPLLDHSEKKSS